MIKLKDLKLSAIIPDSLRDENFTAITRSLDDILKEFTGSIKQTLHLPRLDELSGDILNVLAEQFHLDFFDTTLDEPTKRNLIRQSIELHRRKGTVWAVEFIANQFFEAAQVVEHGGYLFSIKAKEYKSTPQLFKTFAQMFMDYKNERSWLRAIEVDMSPPASTVYAGNALVKDGVIDVGLRPIAPTLTKVYTGTAHVVEGAQTIFGRPISDSKQVIRVGSPLVIGGQVLIDSRDEPQFARIRENPTVELAIGNVAISRGDLYVEDLPYDVVRIFFTFPDSRRVVTLRNPRTDLTSDDIKRVADYAVTHELLIDKAGTTALQAPKAHLTVKRVTTLI